MASPVVPVRAQNVGNAQDESCWSSGGLEELGGLVGGQSSPPAPPTVPFVKWLGITAYQMFYVCLSTGMGVIVLPLEAARFHQENPSIWVGVYMGVSGPASLLLGQKAALHPQWDVFGRTGALGNVGCQPPCAALCVSGCFVLSPVGGERCLCCSVWPTSRFSQC